jgi:hypothetical protein
MWHNCQLDWIDLYHFSRKIEKTRGGYATSLKVRNLLNKVLYLYRLFDESRETGNLIDSDRFIYELHRGRQFQCTDPRDHVYAFLNHYSLRRTLSPLTNLYANYGINVEELYTDVAARALVGKNMLMTLAVAQKSSTSHYNELSDIPSWVPDWTQPHYSLLFTPNTPFCAAPVDLRPVFSHLEPTIEDGEFQIGGYPIGVISACSAEFTDGWLDYPISSETVKRLKDMIKSLCRGGDKSLRRNPLSQVWKQVQYSRTKEEDICAFVRTLCADSEAIRNERGDTGGVAYSEPTRAQQDGLAYIIEAFGENLPQAMKTLARRGNAARWQASVLQASVGRKFATTSDQLFVLGPGILMPGDVVCLLQGGKTPFCLRPAAGGCYKLVGECYVHGLMYGEFTPRDNGEYFHII